MKVVIKKAKSSMKTLLNSDRRRIRTLTDGAEIRSSIH